MLLLTSATDVIQIVTGSATALDVHASWVDNVSGTITPGRTNTEITTATTTTVVAGPASGQRNVQTMLVSNLSASAGQVTINYFDGTATVTLFSLSLLAGYTVQFAAGSGFTVFTSAGVILSAGATGATGASGPTGPAGPQLVSVMQGDQGDEGAPVWGTPTVGANMGPTRAQLAPSAKNWTFLGQGTSGATVRTGVVVWTGTYTQLMVEYFIAGYAGTGVGRILCGNTAPSEIATDCCTALIEGVTLTATSVSVTGWPTAVNTAAAARYGVMFINNQATFVKRMIGNGQYAGTAPTTVPTMIQHAGMYNNSATSIQQMSFVSFATITTNVIGAAFNAGTYFNVWGRNND